MRRLVLLALLAGAVVLSALVPASAKAAAPCRDRIYNDWYSHGKIASTYPLACYRDALKHVPSDAAIYSSLKDDISSALQAAIERSHGKKVPSEVGHGLVTPISSQVKSASTVKKSATSKKTTTTTEDAPVTAPVNQTQTIHAASAATSSGSSGLPVPILVLGGLALLLAGVGAVGAGVRHFKR
jgi:cobalamin biosynthesis Mg chelatase CobN